MRSRLSMATICHWPCMVSSSPPKPVPPPTHSRSFAQMLHDSCDVQIASLPSPAIRGDSLCIKITHDEYEKGLTDCKRNLHGRLVMNKRNKPWTARDLSALAWSMGSLNLKPGFSRLSKWTNDFNPYTQRQTHAQIWIRLMNFPQEYWHRRTLFEIASAIGTPLTLDDSTKNRSFGHYARVLVDMDISSSMYDEIVVERDGFAFKLGVVYERL
ncbi:putative NBS resistance protein, partial [Trifolium pratense]